MPYAVRNTGPDEGWPVFMDSVRTAAAASQCGGQAARPPFQT